MSTLKRNGGKNSLQEKVDQLKNNNSDLQLKVKKLESTASSVNSVFNDITSLLTAGFFRYSFENKSFSDSETLNTLFENCFPPDSKLTEELLIENTHPEDKAFIEELFLVPKTQKKKISGQFRLTQKTKDYKEVKSFLISGYYSSHSDKKLVLACAVRDITRETKQQKELQRNLEKAEDSDKIKTTFLLNISHNIRTPMNSILGFAELLSMTDPEPERLSDYIQVIKKQSKSMLQLIDNVAEIAKYESENIVVTNTQINTNFLITEVFHEIDMIRTTDRREHVKVQTHFALEKGVEIYSDIGKIHQIFIYLLNHFLRYTTEGIIEIGYKEPEDNKIAFYVSNTGYKIGKENLRLLFDRYIQINREDFDRYDDETGLGLTIAKSIVHLLGGKISADTDSETGTCFNFNLPYKSVPEEKKDMIEEETLISAKYNWKDKVILIVEDEEVNALFLEAIFQETGAQTLYARNGLQAVDLCKSINKIDLILMDLRMPVMNGIKATKEIRIFNRSIPIIAQTAMALQEDMEQCLIAGCNDSIIKPIEVEELLALVNNYFAH